MVESFPPVAPAPTGVSLLVARRVPAWGALLLMVGAAALAVGLTLAWSRSGPPASPGVPADEQGLIDLAPPAAGTPPQPPSAQAPAMLYGMLPLRNGHGLRDEQCRRLAADAMAEAGITHIDPGGAPTLFAHQGDYALFVGCHLDQKLILVGAAGPVPDQAESLQEQLLRSLQTRF